MMKSLPKLITLLHVLLFSGTYAGIVSFSSPDSNKFNHLVIDKNSGRVYIGAVNWLYQLQPDLQLQISEKTGPHEDNPNCISLEYCSTLKLKSTNNFNKILVIDYRGKKLIRCGNLFQGICSIHELENISLSIPVKELVAANSENASTVSFIAPGPPNPPESLVLYVGVTFTNLGPYRSEVPAVSSRSLEKEKMLTIAATSFSSSTRMYVNRLAREWYPIDYIFGFSSRGFSYFLTTQPEDVGQVNFVTKIIRICHKDSDYYSYTEIPIKCVSDGLSPVDYNLVQAASVGKPGRHLALQFGIKPDDDVLFAVFSKNKYNMPRHRNAMSAMCVYSLKGIDEKFRDGIQRCFDGDGMLGSSFIVPDRKCEKTQLKIDDHFCGIDLNTPLSGAIPIISKPAITFQGSLITAVSVTKTYESIVVFLGTSNGHLLKVDLYSSTEAHQYADLELDKNSPVNADLLFDPQRKFIYVMTERKLSRMNVSNCNVFNSCNECLEASDPFCGWCGPENECTTRQDCNYASVDPIYWLHYRFGKCIIIQNVEPTHIQWNTSGIIELTVDNLPTLTVEITCVFSVLNKSIATNSIRTPLGMSCLIPSADELPKIATGKHNHIAKLSIRRIDEPDITFTNITFYDCKSYLSCTECLLSPFPCNWCVENHLCTHNADQYCKEDVLITEKNSTSFEFCPRITTTTDSSSEILVPNDTLAVTVKVENLVSPQIQDIKPEKGPKSGGTRLSILGNHLNIGSNIEANIDNLPCKIVNISENHVTCITSASDEQFIGDVWMKFDKTERTLEVKKYHYVEDPIITSVESGPVETGMLRGILSGGIIVRVNGKHFDNVQKPMIYLSYEDQNYFESCIVAVSTYMKCKTPKIPDNITIDSETPLVLNLGFEMDNVKAFRNYSFSLYPNPTFLNFDENNNTKHLKSDYITINGENINLACSYQDITVEIGKNYCLVTSLSRHQLTCRPEISQSSMHMTRDPTFDQHLEVVVTVGGNLQFKIGFLTV